MIHIVLSKQSSDPIYEQIRLQLKQAILRGELASGEQLPSIRALARELEVSVITTKKAYESLEAEQFVESIAGKGTYVAELNPDAIRTKQIIKIKQDIAQIVESAQVIDLTLPELLEMMEETFQQESQKDT
ncbi:MULTISPECIES: GntR family transcriptional regulator [Dolosigranulum]|jgi:regulatory protein gntR HTH|nr:GntR family transcriptional regulator [Dolosigranulum pigrum]QTJ35353.1 GntR family transcriptional regulator [Dolosigranulum pigrum]VTU66822.1 putative transcriptional regulator [Lactobacillus rhamnosus GG] [Dolosigranulum pigrum]